jgi:hypothetical protein
LQLFALKAEAFLKLHRYEEADVVLSAAKKIEGALRKSTSMQADTRTLLVQAQVDMALGRLVNSLICFLLIGCNPGSFFFPFCFFSIL